MANQSRSFDDKFLSRIGKIDPNRVREYLARLLSRKNFFEAVFDHLREGVVVTDSELKIVYANRFWRELMAWGPRKSYFGKSLPKLCPDGELGKTLLAMQSNPRPIDNCEFEFHDHGGRQLLLTSIPVRQDITQKEEPELTHLWVFLLTDVTERRRRIEEQTRAQHLTSLGLLTSGVAHEIKNPLNSLNIHAQVLLQEAREARDTGEPLDLDRVERAAEVILEESDRLTRVVEEFIRAARPNRPIMQRQNLDRLIQDLVRLFNSECEQYGIELRTDLDPEIPPLDMDHNQIFQMLRNLVGNAIEAMTESKSPDDDAPRVIFIRTRLIGDRASIEVADTGPGIEEGALEKIFEPYYTTKVGGTGLGLMVVYRVVAEHRGSIHVDSKPGVGTRFVITLPLVERPVRLLDQPEPQYPIVSVS